MTKMAKKKHYFELSFLTEEKFYLELKSQIFELGPKSKFDYIKKYLKIDQHFAQHLCIRVCVLQAPLPFYAVKLLPLLLIN